jgi:peptidyl-tRNA hydrolase ICT1
MLFQRRLYSSALWDQLRKFKAEFTKQSIIQDDLVVTYSRSSGPGGQNVNKINSKVDIRFHVPSCRWIPNEVKVLLKTNKKEELIVQSDRYRTQQMNFSDCIDKIYQIVQGSVDIPNETSEATKIRVKDLKEREKKKNIDDKKRRSATKSNRRKD